MLETHIDIQTYTQTHKDTHTDTHRQTLTHAQTKDIKAEQWVSSNAGDTHIQTQNQGQTQNKKYTCTQSQTVQRHFGVASLYALKTCLSANAGKN